MDAVDGVMKYIDAQFKAQDVHCPKCKTKQDLSESRSLVTYWGEDGWQKLQCEHCDHEFEVEENVMRTYEVREIGEKSDLEKLLEG